jgi:hypothetical protein
MDRGSTTAFQTEILKDENKPFHLLSVAFDSGTVYLSDGNFAVTYDSNTYNPTGHFLSFSDIVESNQLTIETVTVSLSGVDQTYTNLLLSEDYIDREVKIFKAFLNDSNALVADPIQVFAGRISDAVVTEDNNSNTASISITCSSQFVDFDKTNGRYTNLESQQTFFSDDTGLRYSSVILKDITWGVEGSAKGSGFVATQSGITSVQHAENAGSKTFLEGDQPTNPSLSIQTISGARRLHFRYGGVTVGVNETVIVDGVPTTVFDNGDVIQPLNNRELTVQTLDADGQGFATNLPDDATITSDHTDLFGGNEVTVNDLPVPPVLIETQNGSADITINANNFIDVNDFVILDSNAVDVGGFVFDGSILSKVKSATKNTITAEVQQTVTPTIEPLSTTSGSRQIIVDYQNHGLSTSSKITIANATATNGIGTSELNKQHDVYAVPDNNRVVIQVTSNATATGRGGGTSITIDSATPSNNVVETTASSTTVTFNDAAHGLAVDDIVDISGLHDVGGLTSDSIGNEQTVASVPNANSFTITSSVAATSTESGGGNQISITRPKKATSTASKGSAGMKIDVPFKQIR